MADENMTEETVVSETTKRHRESPRVKAYLTVTSLISAAVAEMSAELEGASKSKQAVLTGKIECLNDLSGRIVSLSEEAPVQNGSAGKKHYIGVDAEGVRTAFDSSTTPVAGGVYVSVLGPFNTKAGSALRVSDSSVPSPVVF